MKKINKSQLLNLGVTAVTLIGMFLTSKAHETEIKELKDEIKQELRQEKENSK